MPTAAHRCPPLPTPAHQEANKKALIQAAQERGLPEDLEVDLKMLYTAITRCRSRLVIAETRSTNPFKKFAQRFRDADKQVRCMVPPPAPLPSYPLRRPSPPPLSRSLALSLFCSTLSLSLSLSLSRPGERFRAL